MKSAFLIFPHQLFEDIKALENKYIFLIEESLFFNQFKFHKQKIVFHRASMKFYESYLKQKGLKVNYIDDQSELSDIRELITYLKKQNYESIHFHEVTDNWLEKRIKTTAAKFNLNTIEYQTPLFINSKKENENLLTQKKKLSQTEFYIHQRKKLNLLINNNKPIGNKWTFDNENRKKYPTKQIPPKIIFPAVNSFYQEAFNYTEKHYTSNYGEVNTKFIYPTTFKESKIWFNQFLKNRFYDFGIYEDAIVENEIILNHSLLSPLLNVGLLTPNYVLAETLNFISQNQIPINSTEGFIRQIIGWREFIRAVYEKHGSYQRTKNFWNHENKIPKKFWDATTEIYPLDNTLKKLLSTAYTHHIERLMILSNFMLLCEFDPNEIYEWFMTMYIDAYDWVMVPNVYGMAQFADGGLMSTKPYISGSNYILKMSNYKKNDWTLIWDSLFWRFIDKNRNFFISNPRLNMLIKSFDKMNIEKKNFLLTSANKYLNLFNSSKKK